jgi:transposase
MPLFHLSIDVAKAKLDCALRLSNGKFGSKVIANSGYGFTQLIDWLASHQATPVRICMEATGI